MGRDVPALVAARFYKSGGDRRAAPIPNGTPRGTSLALSFGAMLPGAATHEGSTADLDTVASVLGEAVRALETAKIEYVLIGGLASAIHGRPRCSSDIDLFVTPACAPGALAALERAGFATERSNPHWLYKGFKDDVLVDLLFKASGDTYLDDEMLRRAPLGSWRDVPVRVIPAEDLIVMKAIAQDEETPRHWGDALGVLAVADLDWDYLLLRARRAPRRLLSLLLYATSLDLHVPRRVLRRLGHRVLHE
jgi:predicted nucleotidyltransferase